MRCALLALVALLRAQALSTQPIAGPAKLHEDSHLQQDWGGLPGLPPDLQALKRTLSVDAEPEDELDDDLGSEYPDEQFRSIEQLDETQLARLSNHLMKVLQRPSLYEPPLILVEEPPPPPLNELDDYSSERDDSKGVAKRSRYYRRYPWKRVNSRAYQNPEYEPYNPCTLTRKDVFKLLVALHDARQGNKTRTVNFCNRKRPAGTVYTNIRFLGRRRK